MPDDTIRFQDADHDLESLERLCWELLTHGASSGRDAFHSGTLSTLGREAFPSSRTMVLRQVDAERRLLATYSDLRALKIEALQEFPRVSWTFYDARRRLELRAMGTMRVYTGPGDALAEAMWASMASGSQHAFAGTEGGGKWQAGPSPTTTGPGPTAAQIAEQSARNYGNFTVLLTFVERLEFLHLHHSGHHRARFLYQDENLVERHWVST